MVEPVRGAAIDKHHFAADGAVEGEPRAPAARKAGVRKVHHSPTDQRELAHAHGPPRPPRIPPARQPEVGEEVDATACDGKVARTLGARRAPRLPASCQEMVLQVADAATQECTVADTRIPLLTPRAQAARQQVLVRCKVAQCTAQLAEEGRAVVGHLHPRVPSTGEDVTGPVAGALEEGRARVGEGAAAVAPRVPPDREGMPVVVVLDRAQHQLAATRREAAPLCKALGEFTIH